MQKLRQHWLIILAGTMLLLAIPSIWPYSYYQILRWVVAILACYNAYTAYESKQNNWMFIMIGISILFNPISPIHFEKSTWAFLDFITAIVMFYSINKIKKNNGI
jgi:hypothetical protein